MFANSTEDAGAAPDFSEDAYEIPDPEFYNFNGNKSLEKFEIGQVWALYSDEDGMPKYYGRIKKVDLLPQCKLHVAWLGVCSTSNDIMQWNDKKILVTCGRFQLRKLKPSEYTSTAPFSHKMRKTGIDKEGWDLGQHLDSLNVIFQSMQFCGRVPRSKI
uniref:DUF3444 domain-containing protein n=1 Tax=Daucus carota subsp. sativus TaxID=79200 RepID=A0A166FSK0_DAUCS